MPLVLAAFLGSAALVVLAGVQLAQQADVIAAETRMGQLWIGSTLLALATSLPELTTDLAAVLMGAPNLAAGDLFGSSMANMLILSAVSLLPAGSALFRTATLEHALGASLAIALNSMAGLLVIGGATVVVFGLDAGVLVIAATYALGTRAIFVRGSLAQAAVVTTELAGEVAPVAAPRVRLRRAAVRFAAAAAVVLLVAPVFARSAARLAEITGLGTTLVGTWMVGIATSLPELVTSLAAVRIGAYDLAVGNLFGSNALNMVMFLPLDLAQPGSIFAALDSAHGVSAMTATLLMATALAALVYRSRNRSIFVPGSMAMIAFYLLGMVLMYLWSGVG